MVSLDPSAVSRMMLEGRESPDPQRDTGSGELGTRSKEGLDDALVEYLELVDDHQRLQARLKQFLSLAFISLSEANYASRSSIRYGRDHYDERMQSTVVLSISRGDAQSGEPTFSVEKRRSQKPEAKDPESRAAGTTGLDADDGEVDRPEGREKPGLQDPLRWFGILVPPSLRASQRAFSDAVQDVLPRLAEVQHRMRTTERRVEELRRRIVETDGE